jgi:cbb3-type cytochrome oxidase maturation protein
VGWQVVPIPRAALRIPHSLTMLVVFLLIFISLTLASGFLAAFIWAVKTGQFEDTCTPSMRMLTDEESTKANRILNTPNN